MKDLSRRRFLQASAAGLLGVALGTGRTDAVVSESNAFVIAGVNDLHLKDAASLPYVERVIASINQDSRITGSMILGDLATGGQPEELRFAKGALDALGKPWLALPGNHDVALKAADILENYRREIGQEHWVREWNHWTFLGFNSCEGVKSDVMVSDAELEWLKAQLQEIAPERPLAVFSHHPLNPHSKAYRIRNADDILGLFSGHALRLSAAGHWHGNQEECAGDVLFTTTACCSSTRDNFDSTPAKGYRLFYFEEDRVNTEFVAVA